MISLPRWDFSPGGLQLPGAARLLGDEEGRTASWLLPITGLCVCGAMYGCKTSEGANRLAHRVLAQICLLRDCIFLTLIRNPPGPSERRAPSGFPPRCCYHICLEKAFRVIYCLRLLVFFAKPVRL